MAAVLRIWTLIKTLKTEAWMLYFAWKHPATPSFLKGLLLLLVVYVVSPIDLLPDYVPLLGIVDDLMIVPAGMLYIRQMLPLTVRDECYRDGEKWRKRLPLVLGLLILAVVAWLGFVYGLIVWLMQ